MSEPVWDQLLGGARCCCVVDGCDWETTCDVDARLSLSEPSGAGPHLVQCVLSVEVVRDGLEAMEARLLRHVSEHDPADLLRTLARLRESAGREGP